MNSRTFISTTIFLIAFICISSSGFAQTSGRTSAADEAIMRANVKKFHDANKKVKVTTLSGERIKGRIVRVGNEDFTIRDADSGRESVHEYSKVSKINKIGGISTAGIITLAAVGAVGAIVAGVFLKRCRNEGGC